MSNAVAQLKSCGDGGNGDIDPDTPALQSTAERDTREMMNIQPP